MSEESYENTAASASGSNGSGVSWLTIVKAILTGLMTVLTALGVSSCVPYAPVWAALTPVPLFISVALGGVPYGLG